MSQNLTERNKTGNIDIRIIIRYNNIGYRNAL